MKFPNLATTATACGVILVAAGAVTANSSSDRQDSLSTFASTETARGSDLDVVELVAGEDTGEVTAQPLAISVPGREIEAPIVPVGVNDSGDFAVPGAKDAGWYRFGAAVDDPGNMVIAAHVDFQGEPGVFFRLAEVEIGDLITLQTQDGPRKYTIDRTTSYRRQALPSSELFTRTGEHKLVLITCGGSFDPASRSYSDNVVVEASPV